MEIQLSYPIEKVQSFERIVDSIREENPFMSEGFQDLSLLVALCDSVLSAHDLVDNKVSLEYIFKLLRNEKIDE